MPTINSQLINFQPAPMEAKNILEQLSSGKRINSAKDDAAGLQIANRLQTQTLSKGQIIRNLNDGISYGQVSDAALDGVTQALQRMRKLALQSASGANSDLDRQALNTEVNSLKKQIDQIAFDTEIFGKKPLTSFGDLSNLDNVPLINDEFQNGVPVGKSSGFISLGVIPPGSKNVRVFINDNGANDDINIFSTSGNHLVGQDLSGQSGNVENQLFTPANGYGGNETYDNSSLFTGGGFNFPATNSTNINGMTFTYSGNGNPGSLLEEVIIDTVTEPLLITSIGSGVFNITVSWDEIGSLDIEDGAMLVTANETPVSDEDYIGFDDLDARTGELGIGAIDIGTQTDAQSAIAAIDSAIDRVGSYRSEVGAKMNAIAGVINTQTTQIEQLSASKQRIEETDFAKAVAEKVKLDIQRDSSTAIAVQARTIYTERLSNIFGSIS